ncbi:MAG: FAD/NAD(P)-binding protein [Acidocella sp.]|nr:FAD/NAD(P)-binding protein [Acidocella sp.]
MSMPAPITERDAFLPAPYRVIAARRELADTVTLDILPQAGARPEALPGQFNMLYVPGVGEAAISLSGATETAFTHTIRDVGAISHALTRLPPGASLGLRGPFGTAWPVAEMQGLDVLIVAGGLGLAPLRPAIRHLLTHRERYGKVSLLIGARTPPDILYPHEIAQWRANLDLHVAVTVDRADTTWHGHAGVVPLLLPRADFDPANSAALICGPEVMMRATAQALLGMAIPAERIHLSLERNMKCAIGLCGHCQFGAAFICKDGPVMRYDRIAPALAIREL